ncbi:outer membrane protein assembly factor BamC [Pseudomonas lalucatii]|uniref:Outer membrane protein assembly factor BamC n=1 Tax=Pseudomonas lalucatii TaxID=1424203 RepID=A0ABS5Q3G0_9PSED|nr:outer membrane protein assembly factor BamC [Pseudomonas lalucatii]MBS7663293.1 outer membrane protein assembly factor BamC [Pseudomonas lalucatii]MBS7724945.1 outer membrane protein assembly factor BamC [Pseudomonas lalucatii]
MKRLAGLSALALIVSSTSGCGWLWGEDGYFRDRGSDYLTARQTAPMQLPANVEAKRLDPLLPVPQQVASSTAEGEFEVPRPQSLAVRGEISEFSLQKSGESRWLVAQRVPAEVWPVARQFFADNGFRIAEERPQTGEFSTEWQRFDELTSAMARRLSGGAGSAAGVETRVRVRIEPGVQRNTSEIFVVSAERPAGSSAEVAFSNRSANPALDATLLDELLASMARSAEQGGSVSLLAARDFDAPSRVSLSEDGNGNPVLNLGADFDRAWSGVGRSLELADVRIDDLNRSLGVYYINLAEGTKVKGEKPGFFGSLLGGEPDKEEIEARAERYQVRLTPVGDSVQVTVEKDLNTVAPADVARKVLGLIQENLG